MKTLAIILAVLIVLIQWPLWVGKGGWLRVWELDQTLAAQKQANAERTTRNSALAAEVQDLKQGTDAIEERARYELGMIKNDEVFFQVVDTPTPEKKP